MSSEFLQPSEFKEPPNDFLIAGWIMFVLGLVTSPLNLGWIFILVTWFMVGIDARNLKVKELKYSSLKLSPYDRFNAGEWFAGCVLLWLIYFPMYLIKRQKLARSVYETISGDKYLSPEERKKYNKKGNIERFVIWGLIILAVIFAVILIFGAPLEITLR